MRLCFILLLGGHIKKLPRETKITSAHPIHVLSYNNIYNYFSIIKADKDTRVNTLRQCQNDKYFCALLEISYSLISVPNNCESL